MNALELTALRQDYPGAPGIIDVLRLDVPDVPDRGEIDVFMGPSGCGKSTLLRYIAGQQNPTQGSVRIRGEEQRRGKHGPAIPVGMVFQHSTVFPWLTARENVVLALRIAAPDIDAVGISQGLLEDVGVADRANALAVAPLLSGGQLRRLEIARALATVYRPGSARVLLLDEPFTGIDIPAKRAVQDVLLRLWRKHELSIVMTTHDTREAVLLADRIHVFQTRKGGSGSSLVQTYDVKERSGGALGTSRDPASVDFGEAVVRVERLIR